MPKSYKKRNLLDLGILVPYLILSIIGLMMVYSTTSYVMLEEGSNPARQAILQFVFWVISLFMMIVIYKMKTSFLKKSWLINGAMVLITIALGAAFLFKPVNGAYGWIQIPSIGTVQPVEFLKFIVIWFLAATLAKRQGMIQEHFWTSTKRMVFPLILQLIILYNYPDLGNAAIIVLLVAVIFLSSGISYLYTLLFGAVSVGGSVLVISLVNSIGKYFLPSHVIDRFAVFRNPFSDEYGSGHQLIHGYYAMFNGGLFGRGLGNSIQKKGFLKFAHTDYAFAIVVEELGLIVAIIILGLLFYMIARMFLIGIRSKDPFNGLMCIGIGSLFLISVFVNLGGITGIIPLTGITFPFISQGGSSLLMFSICVGFTLNISADEKKRMYGLDGYK
ncbi:MAG TPA: FtsW/RodA/SpoVE family cell cycle protein [Candidatus Tetragenococcus pullicola]|nr:FtsW/RodA/SpoVE family cell cycle protein [Candidatus Tetragenococcus pullicola]